MLRSSRPRSQQRARRHKNLLPGCDIVDITLRQRYLGLERCARRRAFTVVADEAPSDAPDVEVRNHSWLSRLPRKGGSHLVAVAVNWGAFAARRLSREWWIAAMRFLALSLRLIISNST